MSTAGERKVDLARRAGGEFRSHFGSLVINGGTPETYVRSSRTTIGESGPDAAAKATGQGRRPRALRAQGESIRKDQPP